MSLVGDYKSSSEDEEETTADVPVVDNKPQKSLLGLEDGINEEDEAQEKGPGTSAGSKSRMASSLKAFLPTPKNQSEEPSRKLGGTSKDGPARPQRKRPHVDPFALYAKKAAREDAEPEDTKLRPLPDTPRPGTRASEELHAQQFDRPMAPPPAPAPPALPEQLPESVLRELQRDGLDSSVIQVRQADYMAPPTLSNQESVHADEQNNQRACLAVASGASSVRASSKTQKRKSQITSLAAELASKQGELEEKRQRGHRTKRETCKLQPSSAAGRTAL